MTCFSSDLTYRLAPMTRWPGLDDHAALLVSARDVVAGSKEVETRLWHGDVQRTVQGDVARRVGRMGSVLDGVLRLSEADPYGSAFALVRATGAIGTDADYYCNPLTRILEMHKSSGEKMTGIVYQSPWERQDAQFR
jgi:hypothetical protein